MTKITSAIITIDQQRYYIQRTRVTLAARHTKHFHSHEADFVPATAISWNKSRFDDSDLNRFAREYGEKDDVWNTNFLSCVLLLLPDKRHVHLKREKIVPVDNSSASLPTGPLVVEISTGRIFKVAKLVKDTQFAFISAIIPGHTRRSRFHDFPAADELEIALPSRLYFTISDAQPLAGLRVAVKDNIALRGLRTGFGSKAWSETYGPEKHTAPCVQQLIDAGVVIVGKVKSSEFAEGVDPTEWVQGICPYNPRGDGQQKPSSSSTGSASAVAAYEWLDIAYGTDTGGSIRHPAGVQGLFGQRPTHGKVNMTGVLGTTPLFDTVGIFAREVSLFTKVGSYLVEPTNKSKISPEHRKYNLLYPTRAPLVNNRDPFHGNQLRWFPHPEVSKAEYSQAEKQIEQVVSRMETELNCQRVPFNLHELWNATHPISQSRSIDEATGSIYGVLTTATACQTNIDQFVRDFAEANDGKEPPMSQLVRARFEYGRQCSDEDISAALEAMQAFSKWVLNDLFGSLDQDATTLLIFPQSWGLPDYRDESVMQTALFKAYFSIYSFAYLCGCPDYTVPIGEVPHLSPITKKIEYLPVSISLIGRPGSDLELFSIVDYLCEKKIISDVKAGRRMYAETQQDADWKGDKDM